MILGTAGLCIFLAQRKHENEAKVEHGQRSAQRKKRSCDGKECAAACCNFTSYKKDGKHFFQFPLTEKSQKGTIGAISSNGSTVEMDSQLTMKQ